MTLTLVAHLEYRFIQVYDSLTFIVENGGLKDRETALLESEHYAEMKRARSLGQKPIPEAFVAKYSLNNIVELESRLPEVSRAPTRVDAFDRFASIERGLEPIEDCVSELELAIDSAIQMEIDIARGK